MTIRAWLLLVGLLMSGSAVRAGPIPSSPIYTNKLRFRIPYHYDAEELKRLGATEIRLFVSRDRGRSWRPVQSVAPDAGKFSFQAPEDGEYWFNVRTLDASRREHPDGGNAEAGLQVIVDTTTPRLDLDLKQESPGVVRLSWNASDDHLDPTQLVLEYIQPGTIDWERVDILPKASGLTHWSVRQGGVVAVRGCVSDFATNTARAEKRLTVAAATQGVPKPRDPGYRQPVAGADSFPFDDQALRMPEQFPGTARTAAKAPAQSPSPTDPALSARDEHVPVGPARTDAASGARNNFVSQRSDDRAIPPVINSAKTKKGTSGAVDAPPLRSSTTRGEEGKPDTNDPSSITAQSLAAHQPTGPMNGAPINPRAQVINSRKFRIGYKLHDVEPSRVASVELYITQDRGATWYRYGEDGDKQSPAQVEVPKEGTYGFALGVRTTDGQSTEVPKNGDAPPIEVVVDETPPRIELLPLRQGRDNSADKVLIQWKYTDEIPADQPIAIYYGAGTGGLWQKISDWTENSGRFVWTVDNGVPPTFRVRIEARDRAGNVQNAESPNPVALRPTHPGARVSGSEAAQKSAPQ